MLCRTKTSNREPVRYQFLSTNGYLTFFDRTMNQPL